MTNIRDKSLEEIFNIYNELNKDKTHYNSTDDICTSMECVKHMLDYIPDEFWSKDIKVLDPCCGNGNFGAYCQTKTNIDNIWFSDLNEKRIDNCKKLLEPTHIEIKDLFSYSTQGWDLIMANPPYSGGGNKNQSISNRIIEHCIDLLNDKGYLCFVTPNNWMTYNNKNTTLNKLLTCGSFLIIDNDVKKYFPSVGSSFTIMVWQKGVLNNKTKVVNNYIIKDTQEVILPTNLNFIPLYLSNTMLSIVNKCVGDSRNRFNYRCDLHNFTRKDLLSDTMDDEFRYETIHTPKKTRFAKVQQDIYNRWVIIIPLSSYYIPYIKHNVNVTQSVGYIDFNTEEEAINYLNIITQDWVNAIVKVTRYGNFNNILVLKHLLFDGVKEFTEEEVDLIQKINNK